jgi:hypothetical protein
MIRLLSQDNAIFKVQKLCWHAATVSHKLKYVKLGYNEQLGTDQICSL